MSDNKKYLLPFSTLEDLKQTVREVESLYKTRTEIVEKMLASAGVPFKHLGNTRYEIGNGWQGATEDEKLTAQIVAFGMMEVLKVKFKELGIQDVDGK